MDYTALKTMAEDKVYQRLILPFYQDKKRARMKAQAKTQVIKDKKAA